MEVLYEVRGENLFIYLPEELDHHNSKVITEQSDWYIAVSYTHLTLPTMATV